MLGTTTDQTENLLDHTVVFCSSEIEDGHAHHNLRVLLAGGGRLGLRQGMHERVDEPTRIANRFVALAGILTVRTDSFGASNGTWSL